MIVVDCAGDVEFASKLVNYVKVQGINAKHEDSIVTINEGNVEEVLKLFLKDSNLSEYSVLKVDSENFVLAKEVPIEDFGFVRCELCGYVLSSEEELTTHRRAHGIQML